MPGMMIFTSPSGRLRLIGWLEGTSFLLLLGLAMPLKYFWGQPEWVRVIGMAHGVLFIAYLAAALQAAIDEGWSVIRTGLIMAASFLPFGTFYADAKWLRAPFTVRS
jgi:integral membrane protein